MYQAKRLNCAYVDQGYTGESAALAAEKRGVQLEVVNHTKGQTWFRAVAPPLGGRAKFCFRLLVSAGWQGTTNDSPKPSPDFTTWPSLSSCSPI